MEKLSSTEFAEALERIAAFYRQNPSMPVPFGCLYVWPEGRENFLRAVKTLAAGGVVNKYAEEGEHADYCADRDFGGVEVRVKIPRKTICRLITPAVYDCPDSLLEAAAEFTEADNG